MNTSGPNSYYYDPVANSDTNFIVPTGTTANTWRRMWDSRPPRFPRRQNGSNWVGGVCEGIGVRYRIDPTIVRLVFAMITLIGGAGITLYLMCMLVFPRYSVDKAPIEVLFRSWDKRYSRDRRVGWFALILMILITGPLRIGNGGVLIATFGVAALTWWALNQHVPNPPEGLMMGRENLQFSDQVDLSGYLPAPGFVAPFVAPTATMPQWDPLVNQQYGNPAMTPGFPGSVNYVTTDPTMWMVPTPPVKKKSRWPRMVIGLAIIFGTFVALLEATSTQYTQITTEQEIAGNYDHNMGDVITDFAKLSDVKQDHTVSISNNLGDVHVVLGDKTRFKVECIDNSGAAECPKDIVNPKAKGGLVTITMTKNLGDVKVDTK